MSKIEQVTVPVHVVILALYIHLRLGKKTNDCLNEFIFKYLHSLSVFQVKKILQYP